MDYKKLRKSMYNQIYYQRKKLQQSQGIEKTIREQELKSLTDDYKTLLQSYKVIVKSRRNSKVRSKIAQLKIKDIAMKQTNRIPLRKKINYKIASKIDALTTNIIYKNDLFDLPKNKIDNINDVLNKTLGYDLNSKIKDIFDVPHRIESGDVYEGLANIVDEVSTKMKNFNYLNLSQEQINELSKAYESLYNGVYK